MMNKTWDMKHMKYDTTYFSSPIPAMKTVDKADGDSKKMTNDKVFNLEDQKKLAFEDGTAYGEGDADCVLNSLKEFEEKALKHRERVATFYPEDSDSNKEQITIQERWYKGYEIGIGFDRDKASNRNLNAKLECPKCGNIVWIP